MPSMKAAYQPLPQSAMDSSTPKECESGCQSPHGPCHRRRRRLFHFAAASLLLLAVLALVSSLCDWQSMLGLAADVGMGRRDTTGTSNDSGVFVKNKLYLIVVFVGLLVCLILGVMLAAWCCKGSFENPCCCPCYLCACCGGLACLECISCGLCAEGVDQIAF